MFNENVDTLKWIKKTPNTKLNKVTSKSSEKETKHYSLVGYKVLYTMPGISHWTSVKGHHRYSYVSYIPWITPTRNWHWEIKTNILFFFLSFFLCELSLLGNDILLSEFHWYTVAANTKVRNQVKFYINVLPLRTRVSQWLKLKSLFSKFAATEFLCHRWLRTNCVRMS